MKRKKRKKSRKKPHIKSIALSLLFVTLFFLLVAFDGKFPGYTGAFAEAESPQENIYSISIDPEQPSVLDDLTITIGVHNTDNKTNDYVLDIFITKDGQLKDENSFTFSLRADKNILFSPMFTPTSVGKHKIIVKLYDKYKAVLYSTKISEINVLSDIGPFDLSLDTLSKKVKPNDEIPLILRMKNVGIRGTDVKIAVSVDCLEQRDIYKDFFVFLKGSGDFDKSLTITACNEEGRRDITAKLILFDHVFAGSMSQVLINSTYYDFYTEFPGFIEIKQGESKVFDVYIKNTAEISVNNLRLMIENIPLEWTTIVPSVIIRLEQNETAIYLVNISIPKDATVIEYPIKIIIGSDDTLVQKESNLKVITGEFVGPEDEVGPELPVGPLIPEEFQNNLIIIFIVVITVVVLIVVLRRLLTRKKKRTKEKVLRKIKEGR